MENFRVVVEISKNSRLKYEIDKSTKKLVLDRVLSGSNVYPQNYGYLEGTLDLDGDPMDVLVISGEVLVPGCEVDVRIIAAMKMLDSGDRDTKFLSVIASDPRYSDYKDLSDIPSGILSEIEDFFKNYKNLEGKSVLTDGFISKKDALTLLEEGRSLFKTTEK